MGRAQEQNAVAIYIIIILQHTPPIFARSFCIVYIEAVTRYRGSLVYICTYGNSALLPSGFLNPMFGFHGKCIE